MARSQGADGKLWITPFVLELFAAPFAWISVQMLHDHEPWSTIAAYALAGIFLGIMGVVWAVFRKRIAAHLPWAQLRTVKEELARAQQENSELADSLRTARELIPVQRPSKLQIISALYRVPTGEGEQYDVSECLKRLIAGDSLVIDIENHSFVAGGVNYVPSDPKIDFKKWLRVEYRYGNRPTTFTVERIEGTRMVLPEDTFIQACIENAQAQLEEVNNKLKLFSPLQLEAFTLAKELRDFYASLGPYPSDPTQNPGEDTAQYLVRFYEVRTEKRRTWEHKLSHGFANRQFGQRITALLHRAGEEFNLVYPALLSSWTGIAPPLSADGIPKLAQEMEMVANWINRRQYNETELLK